MEDNKEYSSEEEKDILERKEKFERDFKKIKEMRKDTPAIVDTQGLSSCIELCSEEDKKLLKFQGLVSLMLSPQTKDNITYETTKKLLEYGLTIDNMIKISEEDFSGFSWWSNNYELRSTYGKCGGYKKNGRC